MRFLVIFLALAGFVYAGESAVFSSGTRLHVDRHEVDGSKIRLFQGAGSIEMDAAQILEFEPDPDLPAPVPEKAISVAAPAATPTAATPQELADRAADKYGLPRKLVRSVMAAESGFQPQAVSPKGAIGLMQLMPATAQALGADPNDPAQNVDAGTRYLRDLLVQYDGRLWHALAAYNAGPGAVEKHNGVPPYRETIQYVNRVTRQFQKGD